ncbi:hypothetical protein TELCIR_02164 [Teladorsagia circumcincta]|uniref:Uncharacterized protein n=1 Tax=Teladorsagia circumcincta TaxID=45464 RepID=A0A2G9UZU2_TELCI|nr:hypothetical protein TELCIR_02164 [Teladorsagia circumcincta]
MHRLAMVPVTLFRAQLAAIEEALKQVRFRYEPPQKDSVEWSLAVDKCVEAIDLPIVVKDRSEHNRNLEELLLHEKSLETSE